MKKMPVSKATLKPITDPEVAKRLIEDINNTHLNMDIINQCKDLMIKLKENKDL